MSLSVNKKVPLNGNSKGTSKMFKTLLKNKIAITFYTINGFFSTRTCRVLAFLFISKGGIDGSWKNV